MSSQSKRARQKAQRTQATLARAERKKSQLWREGAPGRKLREEQRRILETAKLAEKLRLIEQRERDKAVLAARKAERERQKGQARERRAQMRMNRRTGKIEAVTRPDGKPLSECFEGKITSIATMLNGKVVATRENKPPVIVDLQTGRVEEVPSPNGGTQQ